MLPRENRDHGSVLKIFLALGALLALARLGLLTVGAGHLGVGRLLTMLSTFFVAMGVIGTAVLGVFEIVPARANVRLPLLLRDLVLVLGFVVVLFGVLGQSGVDVASLVTTSAVLTAILGLALQSTLTNVLAGVTTRTAIAGQMSALLAERQVHLARKGGEMSAMASARATEHRRDLVEKIRRFFELG
jgi:small-conductance mechanosensitive channel